MSGAADDGSGNYFRHEADIGVIGRGATVEEAFIDAARATFSIACGPVQIKPREGFKVEFEEPDLELALVVWLNALISEAQCRRLALSEFSLERAGAAWRGAARGETWHPGLDRGVEVKGATLTMLSVTRLDGQWEARCVVDV